MTIFSLMRQRILWRYWNSLISPELGTTYPSAIFSFFSGILRAQLGLSSHGEQSDRKCVYVDSQTAKCSNFFYNCGVRQLARTAFVYTGSKIHFCEIAVNHLQKQFRNSPQNGNMRNAFNIFRTNLCKNCTLHHVKVDQVHPLRNRRQKQRRSLNFSSRRWPLLNDLSDDGYLTHHLQQNWRTSSLILRKGNGKDSQTGEVHLLCWNMFSWFCSSAVNMFLTMHLPCWDMQIQFRSFDGCTIARSVWVGKSTAKGNSSHPPSFQDYYPEIINCVNLIG